MLSNHVSPSKEQIEMLQSYPKNTPLVMLNILKFKDQVNSEETGEDVYNRYLKNAFPFAKKVSSKLLWKGTVFSTVIGNSEKAPQLVFLVEYPSVDHFFGLLSDPEYQKVAGDRALALEYGGLVACKNMRDGSN